VGIGERLGGGHTLAGRGRPRYRGEERPLQEGTTKGDDPPFLRGEIRAARAAGGFAGSLKPGSGFALFRLMIGEAVLAEGPDAPPPVSDTVGGRDRTRTGRRTGGEAADGPGGPWPYSAEQGATAPSSPVSRES